MKSLIQVIAKIALDGTLGKAQQRQEKHCQGNTNP